MIVLVKKPKSSFKIFIFSSSLLQFVNLYKHWVNDEHADHTFVLV